MSNVTCVQVLPAALSGRDVIGGARHGFGVTGCVTVT